MNAEQQQDSKLRMPFAPSGDERGVAILLFALLLGAILSVIALALDGGAMMQRRQIFRQALDAAANRGAIQLHDGETDLDKVRATVDAMIRSNLSSMGVDPADMRNVQTMFSEENTRVEIQGSLRSPFWFARAVPGLGNGRMLSESSAAMFHREEVTVKNGDEANIVAVVDISCSMWSPHTRSSTYKRRNGTSVTKSRRIDAVISALQRLIQDSQSGRYLSIVTFDTIAQTKLPPTRITDEVEYGQILTNRQRAMDATYDLAKKHQRCTTRTADGMMIGLVNLKQTLLKPEITSPDQVKVVLVTDGGATNPLTAAVPALGLNTLAATVKAVDKATWGKCNLGTDFIRGSVDTVKVADIMRRLGVTVHVLGVGAMNNVIQGALQLVAGTEGAVGILPCRLLPQPFVISSTNISPPPGDFFYAVSDVDKIFQLLGGTETVLNISTPRLVHPLQQTAAGNSGAGEGNWR